MPGPEPSKETLNKYGLQSGVESKKPYKGFTKATGIGPDPQAERFKQHPILNAITKYVTGVDLDPNKTPSMMDFVAAGMPFFGKAFHGTPQVFEHFEPELYNKADILGSYTHLAENPADADKWVREWKDTTGTGDPFGTNIIPAQVDLKNALDLRHSEIPAEDIAMLSHHMNDQQRARLQAAIAQDNHVIQTVGKTEGFVPHTRDAIMNELTNDPALLHRAGYDGVHYIDYGGAGHSLAIPHSTPLSTPWGTTLHAQTPLGFQNPEFTATGQENLYNAFQPGKQPLPDPAESSYQKILKELPTNPAYK
jgi:hypothetical protein